MADDLISRQAAIASAISGRIRTLPTTEEGEDWIRVSEVRESLKAVPSAQERRQTVKDIKALIEELEVQYEAWGKQYTFPMIIRDIEKFAAGGEADAEREDS